MSDGPHRGVKLRHWRNVLKVAANAATSMDELCERVIAAQHRDMRDIPLAHLERVLSNEETNMFASEVIPKLEEIRAQNPGSSVANRAIDCAVDAIQQGKRGREALKTTLENTCEGHLDSMFKNLEEHTLRQADSSTARSVRNRFDDVGSKIDKQKIVSEVLSPSPKNKRLPGKRLGIDEGPAL